MGDFAADRAPLVNGGNMNSVQLVAAAIACLGICASQSRAAEIIPNTGQVITAVAPAHARFEALNPGLTDFPGYTAGQAVTSIVSPDGRTLLILTSGYNLLRTPLGRTLPRDSGQYVFVYDISRHRPVKEQVLRVDNSYSGIAFDPSGRAFYVPGGVDDNLHVFVRGSGGKWYEQVDTPIALGHHGEGLGIGVKPQAAGVAVTADGRELAIANFYNDSVSVMKKLANRWTLTAELDLRPGKEHPGRDKGVPGGEYPFWVTIKGNDTAYVSSIRDRQVVVVGLRGRPRVVARVALPGQPNKMTLGKDGTLLYVAQDNSDSVGVIDTATNTLVGNIPVTAPAALLPRPESHFRGDDTNSVTVSPDGRDLYVTNGAMNDIAVVRLNADPRKHGGSYGEVVGLIPTGWYPNSVSFSADGKYVYVVNGKSVTGPNQGNCKGLTWKQHYRCRGTNSYDLQLIKAGFQSFPMPDTSQLAALTGQVAKNDHFGRKLGASARTTLQFLHKHIKHVIYIIKENRTYDQILGDLPEGNGDPALAEFPQKTTPNFHRLALDFVDLDNFYDTSEVSFDGWAWSTSALATDMVEKAVPVNYAHRGLSYETEGKNRGVNVSFGHLAQRIKANPLTPDDPDLLPGTANVAAPDGPEGEEGAGYLWDGALRAGLTLRNYGFFVDLSRYHPPWNHRSIRIPPLTDPAATKTQIAYITDGALRPYSDTYFRGFDQSFPDFYRYAEFARDFDARYAKGGLPNLILLRLPHDHTGDFGDAIDGVNTPELQVADNDYAVGLVVQKIAESRYKDDTLIFIIEDDAQDGADHVDAHRSTAFVIGPYVKQHKVISTAYTTLSLYRTMEDILGIRYANLNDALAVPMTDVFDLHQKTWHYLAAPSDLLYNTTLPLPKRLAKGPVPRPTKRMAYWAKVTRGLDFKVEDRLNGKQYNRILWKGLMGGKPYPD